MKKWEYETTDLYFAQGNKPSWNNKELLNKFGEDGWELVNMINHVTHQSAIFKREIIEIDTVNEKNSIGHTIYD